MQGRLRQEEKSTSPPVCSGNGVNRQFQPFKKLMNLNFCLTKGVVGLD